MMRFFIFIFSFLFSVPVFAQTLEEATRLYESGKVQETVILLEKLIRDGNTDAMIIMGQMHFDDDFPNPDKTTGCDWFLKAAEAGNPEGYVHLAVCHAGGTGRKKDIPEAIRLFELGHSLGVMFFKDLLGYAYGSQGNYKKALELVTPFADAQDRIAMNYLGVLFRDGKGVEKNSKIACEWFKHSAQKGFRLGLHNYANCFRHGSGVPKNIAKAKELYQQAANLGWQKSKDALKDLTDHPD